jgi:hypothetical protein
LAKKGEKVSEETKRKMSISQTKPKKICKHCKKMIASLGSHYGNCRKNPDNKERFRLERIDYEKPHKEKIKSQKQKNWKNWISNPTNKKNKKTYQKERNQIPEVKEQNNANRRISRPKHDKKTRKKLIEIIGGYICKNCDFKDHRACVKEHKDDDGYLDNKKFPDKRTRDLDYSDNPEEAKNKLQPYCSNCNAIKLFVHESNKPKKMGLRNIQDRENYHKAKDLAFETLGGYRCVQCKFKDYRALDIEHIHGGGNIHRSQFSRQDQLYRDITKYPKKYRKELQIMCRNCNTIKQHITDYGKCDCKLFHVSYF